MNANELLEAALADIKKGRSLRHMRPPWHPGMLFQAAGHVLPGIAERREI